MIGQLMPASVATAYTRDYSLTGELFAEESASIAHAVESRRQEFVTGRLCARRALRELGIQEAAIPSGSDGEPLWPSGIVGSITHCTSYCASAVARADAVLALGIDAEPNAPLPDGVLDAITSPRERAGLTQLRDVCVDRLLFSAKEAVYKACFPWLRCRLSFEDAEISISETHFSARLCVWDRDRKETARRLPGRWSVVDGVICTAVVLKTGRHQVGRGDETPAINER